MTEHVIVSDEAGIRTIRMNRPEKKNALTMAMYDAMTDALESASTNDAVRCVLFAGVTGAFSAGNDLADFLAATQGTGRWSAQALRFLPALVHCRKPLVAALSGVAVGIGTTMLLHCDYVAVATDARLSTPFVGLGLVPEAASSLLAPRMMGPRRAFELLVMGHVLNAVQAKECGIANVVVAPEDVDAMGIKAAREIAAQRDHNAVSRGVHFGAYCSPKPPIPPVTTATCMAFLPLNAPKPRGCAGQPQLRHESNVPRAVA